MIPAGTKIILLYTMTDGLGDYLVMGDVLRKAERLLPGAEALMVHRKNSHIVLWPQGDQKKRFYNVYSPAEIYRLALRLQSARKSGALVFGLQMSPGSLQGFFFYSALKKLAALDYIVDFNLINADIITPAEGSYILDIHLNQLKKLFGLSIPADLYRLDLPLKMQEAARPHSSLKPVGIHPWNRRGNRSCFVWPFEKWLNVIRILAGNGTCQVSIIGRDKQFDAFKDFLRQGLKENYSLIKFLPSSSVTDLAGAVASQDVIISVNSSVVHIGYAFGKKMVILAGPSLDQWSPKGNSIITVGDHDAVFSGVDRYIADDKFPTVQRIRPEQVIEAFRQIS
ncbi:MAG: glycosyltransferase family 9 protein [Candidatus Omnitrophica bacterium]|nr:glycosyltransferase family 9 protein [Candidatus Omnitrophota bacterium]